MTDIDRQFAEDMVRLARAGDTEAAREILQAFITAVSVNRGELFAPVHMADRHPAVVPLHAVQARYVADAFEKILSGDDPKIALGIKTSKPGRRKGTTTHDHAALAAAYWLLVRRGHNPEDTATRLGQKTGTDRVTIYLDRRDYAGYETIDEPALVAIMKPYAKAVDAILNK